MATTFGRYLLIAILVSGVSFLGACSSSDGSGTALYQEGVFVDAPVEGLAYKTQTRQGVTGTGGSFEYLDGEKVKFSVGGIFLGEASGKALMSPLDLVPGATDETNPTVTNICRFLITLDDDNDLRNGIQISEQVRQEAEDKSLSFDQTIEAFEADENTKDVMQALTAVTTKGEQGLVLAELAQIHLHNSLGLKTRAAVHLSDYLPDKWEVGEKVLGLEITEVEKTSYGTMVKLENPFAYIQQVALTVGGEYTAISCPEQEELKGPITIFLEEGYTLKDLAAELQGAIWEGAFAAVNSFIWSPHGYCSAEDPYDPTKVWYVSTAEKENYDAIVQTECPPGEPPLYSAYYACEQDKCVDKAMYERLWAQRLAQRALNDDVIVRLNVASYIVYYHIILTALPEDEHDLYKGYLDSIMEFYGGVKGQTGFTEAYIKQPEYDMAACLYSHRPPDTAGIDPDTLKPIFSFNFNAGPIAVTYGSDGSWAVSGGQGWIVGIAHNPNSKKITVTMAVGVDGNLGPYSVGANVGIEMTIQDGEPSARPTWDVGVEYTPGLSVTMEEPNSSSETTE